MLSPTPIPTLIADDQELIVDALAALLSHSGIVEVIGTAKDGAEAVQQAQRLQPRLILMDIKMPVMSGIEAAGEIRRRYPEIHILLLTSFEPNREIADACSQNADGYLLKKSSQADLLGAIERVMQGQQVFDSLHQTAAETATLTHRERQVLKGLVEGLKTREIADLLHISPRTVEKHRAAVHAKLGTHSPTRLLTLAERLGLVGA
jgi:DNA-binding NarL/FixJ family response regulator